jgi:hypothetical protein
MAQDQAGRKFNRIEPYQRIVNGVKQTVSEHVRSNRSDSKGASPKKGR